MWQTILTFSMFNVLDALHASATLSLICQQCYPHVLEKKLDWLTFPEPPSYWVAQSEFKGMEYALESQAYNLCVLLSLIDKLLEKEEATIQRFG